MLLVYERIVLSLQSLHFHHTCIIGMKTSFCHSLQMTKPAVTTIPKISKEKVLRRQKLPFYQGLLLLYNLPQLAYNWMNRENKSRRLQDTLEEKTRKRMKYYLPSSRYA